jgi:hypothetical protein
MFRRSLPRLLAPAPGVPGASQANTANATPQAAGFGNITDQMLPSSSALFRPIPAPRTVAVIPAPMTYGQPFMGTDKGPDLLLDAGINSSLTQLGWRVSSEPEVSPVHPSRARPQPAEPGLGPSTPASALRARNQPAEPGLSPSSLASALPRLTLPALIWPFTNAHVLHPTPPTAGDTQRGAASKGGR